VEKAREEVVKVDFGCPFCRQILCPFLHYCQDRRSFDEGIIRQDNVIVGCIFVHIEFRVAVDGFQRRHREGGAFGLGEVALVPVDYRRFELLANVEGQSVGEGMAFAGDWVDVLPCRNDFTFSESRRAIRFQSPGNPRGASVVLQLLFNVLDGKVFVSTLWGDTGCLPSSEFLSKSLPFVRGVPSDPFQCSFRRDFHFPQYIPVDRWNFWAVWPDVGSQGVKHVALVDTG
jgi:hypothetical protein